MAPAAEKTASPRSWPLWQAYTRRFLDDQGRVIDRSAGDRTTSEGQAYALFFALVDNDRGQFDKILRWTEANLAGGDLTARLPAWEWGKSEKGEWKTLDQNSASDADLWLAYTLLEAGRLWREPRFGALGRVVAARVAKEEVAEVPTLGKMLLPGRSGFHPENDVWILNPSYAPPSLLACLAATLPSGPWKEIAERMPRLVDARVSHGFAMDWVAAGSGSIRAVPPPREPSAGTREQQAGGSYDAIRVYLWAGIAAPGTAGGAETMEGLKGMAAYLGTAPTPPLEVDQGGHVLRGDSPVGFSAAVVPYLVASGLKLPAEAQADRMRASLDPASGLYGHNADYYDENLALFSTGWSESRYRFERDGKLRLQWK